MAILIMCANPACGELFDVPDDQAGLPARCPSCGTVQTAASAGGNDKIPARPTYATPAAPAGSQDTPDALPPATPPPKSPPPAARQARPAGQHDQEDIELIADDGKPPPRRTVVPPAAPPSQNKPEPGRYRPSEEDLADSYKGWLATQKAKQQSPIAPLTESLEEEAVFEGVLDKASPAPPIKHSDGVLEHRPAARAIFLVGGLGMSIGAAFGLTFGWGQTPVEMILSIYSGIALGWVVGFILAFLFVMTAERSESKIRCSVCGQIYAEGAEQCNWCGSAIGPTPISPLAVEGMQALGYATSNTLSIAWIAILTGLLALVGTGLWQAMAADRLPSGVHEGLIGMAILLGMLLWSTAGKLFLDAVAQNSSNNRKAPDPPSFLSLTTLTAGIKLLAVLIIHLLPGFTMPLLPVSLWLMSKGSGGFHPAQAQRIIQRRAKEFTILWLILLVWLAALALATALSWGLWRLTALLPTIAGFAGGVFQALLVAVGAAFYAAVVTIFVLAIARCISLYGKEIPKRIIDHSR